MIRKKMEWKVRDHALELGPNTLIVAVLNVTPDSFSDGGSYSDPDAAAERALELQEQGADIIDIGAESTKPGSERVSEAEELRRLIPVLKRLKGRLSIPISVDTYKVAVAEAALEHGASIINDVSGLTWEPDLAKTVIHHGAGLILNHMRGTPETWAKLPPMRDVMGEILTEIQASLHRAVKAGVPSNAIVIDPGIGFGKRKEQNSEILARLPEMKRLLTPILVGASRKSFLAQDTAEGTEFATAAAVTAAILNGAYLVRVHDVVAMRPVVAVADAVLSAVPERAEAPVTRVARRDEDGQVREFIFGDDVPKRPIVPPALSAKKKADKDVKDLPLLRRGGPKRAEVEIVPVGDDEIEEDLDVPLDPDELQREWEGEKPRRDFRDPPLPKDDPRDSPGDVPRPPRETGDRPAYTRKPAAAASDRPAAKRPAAGDRPPRPSGPPRRDDDRGGGYRSGPPSGGRPSRPSGPPRRDDDRGGGYRSGPPSGARPPRRDDGPPPSTTGRRPRGGMGPEYPPQGDGGDRPPRGPSRPAGRDGEGRPPRGSGGSATKRPFRPGGRDGEGRPPRGSGGSPTKRPFRPGGPKDDRGPRSGGGSPTKRPFRPGGPKDDRGPRGGGGSSRPPGRGPGRGPSTPRKRS
ncbi:MAG: dihydropteroate synthase [Bryobacteraceae bacterium]|nr:dihydropteroate synthase [Bryobacteraceae bacterium]